MVLQPLARLLTGWSIRPGEPLAPNAISEIFGALADRMRQVVDVAREGAWRKN
jgi:hypothetical protein